MHPTHLSEDSKSNHMPSEAPRRKLSSLSTSPKSEEVFLRDKQINHQQQGPLMEVCNIKQQCSAESVQGSALITLN